MTYQTRDGLNQGIKSNSVCRDCQNKNHQKHNLDEFFNEAQNVWEKPCPQCESIILYDRRKDMIRSLKRGLICRSCVAINKIIDYTTHLAYNSATKTWVRNCPQCNDIIHYIKFSSYRTGESNNAICASCAMTEVANRPEIRLKSSLTMKKIISTAFSKKEIELFNLIKHLDFVHNDEGNLINIAGYFPDIIHSKHKLIVEFYGDKYHANPMVEKFSNDDAIIKIGSEIKTAKQIRDRDDKRQRVLEENGYQVIIVWENIFNIKNRDLIVKMIEDEVIRYENSSL